MVANNEAFLKTPAVKILKFFIVTTLFSTYVAYIYNAWLKYDKDQVGMSILVQHVSSFSLPDMSICALVPSNVSEAMEKADSKRLVINVLNTDQFFTTMYSPEQSYWLHDPTLLMWSQKARTLANGIDNAICYTISFDKIFVMDSGSRNGVYVVIDASILPRKNFQFTLSMPEESVILKMESDSMTTSLFKGNFNSSKSVRFITTNIEKTITLNRNSQPCLEKQINEEDSYHRCIWRYFNEKFSCVLGGFFDDTNKNEERPCNKNTTMHAANQMLRTMAKSSKEIYDLTMCRDQCTKTNYKVTIGDSQILPELDLQSENHYLYTDILYFYIPTSSITVKEEFLIYDWLSFVADCGGMGGILLGLSLLAGYQSFMQLLPWAINRFL